MTAPNRQKILMIGFELPPFNSGGLGVACLGLTKALANLGFDITFLLPKKLDYKYTHMRLIFANEFIKNDVNERDKNKFLLSKKIISTYTTKTYKNIMDLNYEEVENLMAERAKKENFDIIHAHDWMTFNTAIKIKKLTGKKLTVQIHSTEIDRSPLEGIDKYKYEIEKKGMEEADLVIAVSQYTKELINKFYGIPLEKIRVVYNASEMPEIEKSVKLQMTGPLILFLGRITYQKGTNHLLHVARKVVDEIPNAKFVISGDGDMYHEMINNAATLGLSGNIIFAGFLRGLQKETVLNSCSLFVMPSLSEPFGIVALEAANFGMPVLVSKQSGARELLQGAIVADFWDTDLMAKQIIDTLNKKSKYKKLVKQLQKDLSKITWDNSAIQCQLVYNELA